MRELEITGTDSSDDDHVDLAQMFLGLDLDVQETFTSSLSSDSENQINLDVNIEDSAIAKIHTWQCRGHPKNFVGKIG